MIVSYLRTYLSALEFDTATTPHPYLFAPAGDVSRCMSISAWSQHAKGVIKRWTGVAAPPVRTQDSHPRSLPHVAQGAHVRIP
jgi:hypothetical protein